MYMHIYEVKTVSCFVKRERVQSFDFISFGGSKVCVCLIELLKKMYSPNSIYFVRDQEFNMFHNMDRELYGLLVMNLWRDPVESFQFMALWLWLERVGFKHTVQKILTFTPSVINDLADEAFACLNVINTEQASSSSAAKETSLMQSLINKDLRLRFFSEHRAIATHGMRIIINQVCNRVFMDIMHHAIQRNAAQSPSNQTQQQKMVPQQQQQQQQQMVPQMQQQQVQVQPMVQYGPTGEGLPWTQTNVVPPADRSMFMPRNQTNVVVPPGNQTMYAPWNQTTPSNGTMMVPWTQTNEAAVPQDNRTMMVPWTRTNEVVPADDRTMFVTFSKGYPVYEWEVMEFFTGLYGDCIESLHMQEVRPNEQSLFARIVCYSVSVLDVILNGTGKAKFNINGKHVWARKFVPKHRH